MNYCDWISQRIYLLVFSDFLCRFWLIMDWTKFILFEDIQYAIIGHLLQLILGWADAAVQHVRWGRPLLRSWMMKIIFLACKCRQSWLIHTINVYLKLPCQQVFGIVSVLCSASSQISLFTRRNCSFVYIIKSHLLVHGPHTNCINKTNKRNWLRSLTPEWTERDSSAICRWPGG